MTVCLAILTKNEEENIARAIESAEPYIDSCVILDTGSTDKTLEVATKALDRWRIPFSFASTNWTSFDEKRNELLELATAWLSRPDREYEGGWGDYILLMDADEQLIDREPLPELTKDAYYLRYAGPLTYSQPRLIRASYPWDWRGKVHAWLDCSELEDYEVLDKPQIVHHGEKRHGDSKLRSDVALLTQEWQADPSDARTCFMLAKCLEGLGENELALDLYRKRVEMGGFPEEVWYARYRLGCLLGVSDFHAAAEELLTAFKERPWRTEPLRALAIYCNDIADQIPFPEDEILFIHRNFYSGEPTN